MLTLRTNSWKEFLLVVYPFQWNSLFVPNLVSTQYREDFWTRPCDVFESNKHAIINTFPNIDRPRSETRNNVYRISKNFAGKKYSQNIETPCTDTRVGERSEERKFGYLSTRSNISRFLRAARSVRLVRR